VQHRVLGWGTAAPLKRGQLSISIIAIYSPFGYATARNAGQGTRRVATAPFNFPLLNSWRVLFARSLKPAPV